MKHLAVFTVVILTASVAMADLAGYWAFDDGSGTTAVDSSENGKDGSLYAADGFSYPQWITGHDDTGGALQFNSNATSTPNSNHVLVDIGAADDLANLGEAFTIAMWVRRDAVVLSNYWPSLIYTDAYDAELATDPYADPGSWDSHDYFWCDLNASWQLDLDVETEEQKTFG